MSAREAAIDEPSLSNLRYVEFNNKALRALD